MTCCVCGQGLGPRAQAPTEPDRHRWCSREPGRYLPVGQVGVQAWIEPLPPEIDLLDLDDLPAEEIERRFAVATRAIRRRARG